MGDFYTLDSALRRNEVIDWHESLIWTERYAAYGDFELVIRADRGTRALLPVGTRLARPGSKRIMEIETIENDVNSDGVSVLKINGRSFEKILDDRAATPNMSGSVATPKWTITGLPADIARYMFNQICVVGVNSANDKIPYYTAGTLLLPGTIPEPSTSITVDLPIDTLYVSIKKICDLYDLGFRLIRNEDYSQVFFDIYTGDDRTTLQTTFPAVVFSPDLDNLSNTKELTSTAAVKNVAYVIAPNGSAYVYADGWDSTTATGYNRRVLLVKADDITLAAGAPLTDALTQRGKEALSECRVVIAFDGEVPQFGSYVYPIDYDLGDLVETRSIDGLATNMRVTEQIFVDDAQGERSYPTLVSELLITAGSWFAWETAQVWIDATGEWGAA